VPNGDRFAIVPVRVLEDRRLSDGAIVTYTAIASFADRYRIARPGWSTLCTLRGVTKSTLAKHVAELVAAGHLERLERGRYHLPRLWRSGPSSSTLYPQGPDPHAVRSDKAQTHLYSERTEGMERGVFLPGTGWIE
jgi:Helix-turn-helix domain